MAFVKKMEEANTGAPIEYHRVNAVTIDLDAKQVHASVKSYVSKAVFEAGKNHAGYAQCNIPGLPGAKDDPFAWAQDRLLTGEGSMFLGGEAC